MVGAMQSSLSPVSVHSNPFRVGPTLFSSPGGDLAGDRSTTGQISGQTFSSDLGFLGDVDYILASFTAGFARSLIVDTTSDVLDLYVELRNAADQRVYAYAAADGASVFVPFTISLSGDYFISIRDSSDNDVGDYAITIDDDDTILD